jgi:hypothetical protein
MPLDPNYAEGVWEAVEKSYVDLRLYNAICDAIDLVCDRPGSAEARHSSAITVSGERVWIVPVRGHNEDWKLIWRPRGEFADLLYLGL